MRMKYYETWQNSLLIIIKDSVTAFASVLAYEYRDVFFATYLK